MSDLIQNCRSVADRLMEANNQHIFRASASDFKTQAASAGWTFWRGVAIGFVCAFPIGFLAATGHFLPTL